MISQVQRNGWNHHLYRQHLHARLWFQNAESCHPSSFKCTWPRIAVQLDLSSRDNFQSRTRSPSKRNTCAFVLIHLQGPSWRREQASLLSSQDLQNRKLQLVGLYLDIDKVLAWEAVHFQLHFSKYASIWQLRLPCQHFWQHQANKHG